MAHHSAFRRPRTARPLVLAALLGSCLPAAALQWIDFRQKTSATNAWLLSGTAYSAERGLKFAEAGSFAERSGFDGPVTSVVAVTYCSGARIEDPFTVAAGRSPAELADCAPPIAYVYTKYVTNTFAFALDEDVRAVRIRSSAEGEVKGNYYLSAVGLGWVGEPPESPPPDDGPDPVPAEDVETMWRVSDFTRGAMRETFAWTTNVAKTTVWTNGVTVTGFHAFRNADEIVKVGKDSGRATGAGLYASRASEWDGGAWSLSMLASGTADVTLELRVLNDRRGALDGAQAAFDAYQWTFPESGARTMSFAWAATRTAARPAEDAWHVDDGAGFATLAAPTGGIAFVVAPRTSATRGLQVPGGGVLWLRWRVPRGTSCPMFGVGDVRLSLIFRRATEIILR